MEGGGTAGQMAARSEAEEINVGGGREEEERGRSKTGRQSPPHAGQVDLRRPPGVNAERRRICQLINCSKLAELSFSICPLKVKEKGFGGGR